MKKRPIVAIDIDGTIRQTFETLARMWKKSVPLEVPFWKAFEFPNVQIYQFELESSWKRMGMIYTDYYQDVMGMIYRLEERDKVDIVYVTNQPTERMRDTVYRWIVSYLNEPNVIMLNQNSKHLINADLFIDDDPRVIKKLLEHGKNCVMISRPWNWSSPYPGRTVKTIERMINSL